ncbi:MAG: RNA polymerase sigma factor SigZ [Nitrospira sp.]|nr:RNA polymerase sigma factor SigZ [Nitrospira sp.]MBH0187088.1 RNA polymerase sigma factor SigZ [Nitrospira sp.]
MTTTTEELWQLLHDGLRGFIAKRVSDQVQVDDILQDVFMRVHLQIGSVNDPGRLVSWIYQVTRNTIIDYYRKPGRLREVPAGLGDDIEEFRATPTISDAISGDNTGELRTELAGCLRPMIERLSKHYRDAIMLVEIEGLTQQGAATRMGISLSGMKSRVQRGRTQLKHLLDECCRIELDRRGGVREFEVRDTGCDPCQSQPDRSYR